MKIKRHINSLGVEEFYFDVDEFLTELSKSKKFLPALETFKNSLNNNLLEYSKDTKKSFNELQLEIETFNKKLDKTELKGSNTRLLLYKLIIAVESIIILSFSAFIIERFNLF